MLWIMGSTRVAKKVGRKCYDCRLKDKKIACQQMGGLPKEWTTRLVLCPENWENS